MLKVFALAVGAELAGGGRLAAGKLAAGEYEYLAAGAERVADAELAAGAELAVDTERVAGGRLAADEFAAGECLSADEYEALRGLVSREKAERLGRFRRFADAARSLLGDVMARRAICLATGLQNCELRFELGERQKPMLAAPMRGAVAAGAPHFSMPHSGGHGAGLAAGAGLGPAVVAPARDGSAIAGSAGAGPAIAGLPHFNISHSGRHVVCALCDAPVGIDVEIVRPIDMNIANRFFSADERGRLFSEPADGHGRLELFYSIWTRKESFIKMTGEGLSRPLGSFSVFGPLAWGGGAACCRRIGVGGDAICHVCHASAGEDSPREDSPREDSPREGSPRNGRPNAPLRNAAPPDAGPASAGAKNAVPSNDRPADARSANAGSANADCRREPGACPADAAICRPERVRVADLLAWARTQRPGA